MQAQPHPSGLRDQLNLEPNNPTLNPGGLSIGDSPAELSGGPDVADTEADRIARRTHLQQAENDFDVIAFDAGAARAFGAVAGAPRNAGRKNAARAYDALIAATAISEGFPLYTCNPDDFEGIPRLDLRAVLHPDAQKK